MTRCYNQQHLAHSYYNEKPMILPALTADK